MLCNTEFCSLCEKAGLLRVCFRVWFCKARKLPFQTGDFPAICTVQSGKRLPVCIGRRLSANLILNSARPGALQNALAGEEPRRLRSVPERTIPAFSACCKTFRSPLIREPDFKQRAAGALQTALAGENPGGSEIFPNAQYPPFHRAERQKINAPAFTGAFIPRARRTYASSLIFAKHSLQYTGRSSRGRNGTLASFPQLAHTAVNISRSGFAAFLRASRQALHLCGSFTKPLDA